MDDMLTAVATICIVAGFVWLAVMALRAAADRLYDIGEGEPLARPYNPFSHVRRKPRPYNWEKEHDAP